MLAGLALLIAIGIGYQDAPDNAFHLDDFVNIVEHPPTWLEELALDSSTADRALPNRLLKEVHQIGGKCAPG